MAKDRSAEALDLSEEILRNFELSEIPTQHIVLKCLRLARITNDVDSIEWLNQEAHGFETDEKGLMTPAAWSAAKKSGRRFFIEAPKDGTSKASRKEYAFTEAIAVMEASLNASMARMAVAHDRDVSLSSNSTFNQVAPRGNVRERRLISDTIVENTAKIEKVKSRLYQYVSNVNYELKFGEITEDIFTRKRKFVDNKLKDISPESIQKFVSVYENLKSTNDEDWANAAHTCRRIIKEVADVLYPPSDETITLPNGKKIKVGEEQYINRLIQYIESKSESGSYKAIVGSNLGFIGDRLDGVHNAANKGTHTEVTLEEAERYIIYTYLLIGDILAL